MKSCPQTQEVLTRHLEASLTPAERQQLREHLQTCPACASAFEQMNLLGEIMKDALQTETTQERAAERISARLMQEKTTPGPAGLPFARGRSRLRRWMAAAALLVIGTALSLVYQSQKTFLPRPPARTPVAVQISQLQGTVLVKHRDEAIWYTLDVNTPVYLGDTFHTAGTASVALALNSANHMDIAPNSMLTLVSYDDETEFYLEHGQCTPVLNGPHGPFFIGTPNGRLEALGTKFTVIVTE